MVPTLLLMDIGRGHGSTRAEGSSGADLGEDLGSSMWLINSGTDGYQQYVDM